MRYSIKYLRERKLIRLYPKAFSLGLSQSLREPATLFKLFFVALVTGTVYCKIIANAITQQVITERLKNSSQFGRNSSQFY